LECNSYIIRFFNNYKIILITFWFFVFILLFSLSLKKLEISMFYCLDYISIRIWIHRC
jgi:hypothetical protein